MNGTCKDDMAYNKHCPSGNIDVRESNMLFAASGTLSTEAVLVLALMCRTLALLRELFEDFEMFVCV